MAEFCPECKSILLPMKMGNKEYLACSGCGFKKDLLYNKERETPKPGKKIEVVTDEIHPMATHKHKCKKCGFDKCYVISKGIWYSDEDEVLEYICGKCGKAERAEGIRVK